MTVNRAIRLSAIWLFLVAAVSAASVSSPAAQSRPAPPQRTAAARRATPPLVVLIVVDQFRGDYVQKYGGMWTKGLRRLLDSGAYFPLAAYPYSFTVTCAGHSTIGTGAFPRTHGMIGNTWYDRETKKAVACTQDASVTSIPYGGRPGKETHSAKWLMTTTFADELRAQSTTPVHVESFSLKPRAVIGMAGHGGDMLVWEEDSGTWATSSAFAKTPSPAFDTWAKAHPIDSQVGRVWDRLLPAASYFFDDQGVGEPWSSDWPNVFPHVIGRAGGPADQSFLNTWVRTPFVDEALADMAIAMSEPLGKGKGTDMLAISFSAIDEIGHRWGPASHEVQDALARLDVQLGKIFDALDRRLGADNYVVALSADHGVAPIPEQMTAMGIDAGRFTTASTSGRIMDAWRAAGVPETTPIASLLAGTDVYFTPTALATIKANRALRDAITNAALSAPGIAKAYWGDDLDAGQPGDDPVKRAAMLSYVAGRSADLILIPKQYWIAAATGTTHGTPSLYDQRVPLILMGFGIKPGRYLTTVTPADVAPSLALLAGITLPRAEGRVLGEAIR